MIRIKQQFHFVRDPRGRHRIGLGPEPEKQEPKGTIPRVSRLMALAIHFDEILRAGKVDSQTTLASLARVTQPRMNQILALNYLAPDIQESILHLPLTKIGRDPIHEKMLRKLAAEDCWKQQRKIWQKMTD